MGYDKKLRRSGRRLYNSDEKLVLEYDNDEINIDSEELAKVIGGGASPEIEERLETVEGIAAGYSEYVSTDSIAIGPTSIKVIDTGKEWINGKKIYRAVIRGPIEANGSFHTFAGNIERFLNLEILTDLYVVVNDRLKYVGNGMFAQNDNSRCCAYLYNTNLEVAVGNAFANGSPVMIDVVIEFTRY